MFFCQSTGFNYLSRQTRRLERLQFDETFAGFGEKKPRFYYDDYFDGLTENKNWDKVNQRESIQASVINKKVILFQLFIRKKVCNYLQRISISTVEWEKKVKLPLRLDFLTQEIFGSIFTDISLYFFSYLTI